MMHALFVVAMLLLPASMAEDNCGQFPSCEMCTNSAPTRCAWIPNRFSCISANATSFPHLPSRISQPEACPSNGISTFPPTLFSHACERGGIHTEEFKVPCECAHASQTGSKCQICSSDSDCNAGEICTRDIKQVAAQDSRELSCECNSEFCEAISFTPALGGIVNVRVDFDQDSRVATAQIDLVKNIPLLRDSNQTLVSPVLFKAELSECTSYEVPCRNACGKAEKCTDAQVLDKGQCRVWECAKHKSFCPSAEAAWSAFKDSECGFIEKVIAPPFHFVCAMTSAGADLKCSFDTALLAPGLIMLNCKTGTCTDKADGRTNDKDAPLMTDSMRHLLYFLILLLPIAYTLLLALYVRNRTRKIAQFNSLATNLEEDEEDHNLMQHQERAPSPHLSFHHLAFSIKLKTGEERRILRDVSGEIPPGSLCCIIGPSGAGKSTLIDILAGRKSNFTSGTVALDNYVCMAEELKQRIGFVSQEDNLLPSTSTVRECILFHASLRGNSTMPLLNRCQTVQRVISKLKLDNCSESFIGGGASNTKSISGGERRRVSVACELVGENNQLLLLDEPTTGLDSSSALTVINCLQDISQRESRTIALSIHQPSTVLFNKFTWILVMSQFGTCLYCGALPTLYDAPLFGVPFPASCNPSEHLIDLCLNQEDQASVAAIVLEEPAQQLLVHQDLQTRHEPTWLKQVSELSMRSMQNAYRHPFLAITNVFATSCVALSCGLLYRGVTNDLQGAMNRAGLFFFFLCFLCLASIGDLGVFQEERHMVSREKANGAYRSSAYLFSKMFSEILPLRIIPLVLTSFTLTGMVGLNSTPHAVFFLFALLLGISLVSTLQFLCLGMIFPKSGVANFMAILVTMFNLLMSGFLLQFEGTGGRGREMETSGLDFLQQFSVLHFGFEALMVNEMHGLNFEIIIKAPDGSELSRVGATGDLLLVQLGFSYNRFGDDVARVLIFFLSFYALAWFLLAYLVVEQR